jgi:subtilisin
MRPAWSEQFAPGALGPVTPLCIPVADRREWAWGGADGGGVRVAVVDSGVDADHPQVGGLAGAVAVEVQPDGSVALAQGAHEDLVGHGTACAGIIRRVAPACELYSVRVLGPSLKGKGVAFVAGLRWAVEAGMDVVNLSLSTANPAYLVDLHELVDRACFGGTVLVSAVNNVPSPSYPSLFAGVCSVAAHDRTDPFALDCNPDPPVEFGAPGIGVPVAWTGGGSITATGNSFAAAHVSGLVARLLSKHPGLTPFQVKTVLHAVADNARP